MKVLNVKYESAYDFAYLYVHDDDDLDRDDGYHYSDFYFDDKRPLGMDCTVFHQSISLDQLVGYLLALS